jgi:hypothetical protein
MRPPPQSFRQLHKSTYFTPGQNSITDFARELRRAGELPHSNGAVERESHPDQTGACLRELLEKGLSAGKILLSRGDSVPLNGKPQ